MDMLKFITVVLQFQSSQLLNPFSALSVEVFAYHNETNEKAQYAFDVVEKINKAFRQWFFTVIFCEFTYFENRILKYIEARNYGYPVLLLNSCPSADRRKVKPKLDKHGQTTYVVTSSQVSPDFNELVIEAILRTGVFKPRSIVVFVINIPVEVDSYFYYSMHTHFQLLWSRKITNSVLIVYSDQLEVYTYNPFLDIVFDITNEKNIETFLSRMYKNLHEYKLRLSVFRKIYISEETGPLKCNSNLATSVMHIMNATCVPLPPRDGSTVGDLLDNGTATGVTKDLLDGYTDLELNSRILKNSYYGYIDTTYPLSQDELCFVVKKSDRQSTFTTTIKLISMRMLLIFLFNVKFFIVMGIIARKVETKLLGLRQRRVSSILIDLVKCLLKQTYDVKFPGAAFRTVVLIVIMYSLIINCVIESIITSAVTYPRYKTDINTIPELMKSNLTFGIHNRHLKLFKNSMPEEQFNEILNRIEIFNDKKIRAFIDERQYQYAVLLRKSDALTISRKLCNMKKGRPLFHTVQECPIPCSIVYGLSYGSPYLPRLNNILYHLYQGGILLQWTNSEELTLTSNIGRILSTANANKERKSLNIGNLQEVFYVWCIGLLISTIIFGIEIVYQKLLSRLWI